MWQRQPVEEAMGAYTWSAVVQTLLAELQGEERVSFDTLIHPSQNTCMAGSRPLSCSGPCPQRASSSEPLLF